MPTSTHKQEIKLGNYILTYQLVLVSIEDIRTGKKDYYDE